MQIFLEPQAAFDLLITKLSFPVLPQPYVPRPGLWRRLELGLQRKVILLSAPAGAGKTTLASAWLAERQPRLPAAWVALEAGDNDPYRFWRYVFSAVQDLDWDAGVTALGGLDAFPAPEAEALLTGVINRFTQLDDVHLLVLDDLHCITNPQIHAALGFLLEHLPPSLRLVLLTRHDPDLPLGRLRASGQVCELRLPDLRFSREETGQFLREALQPVFPQPLPDEMQERIWARTEGWVAGLHLAALALRSHPDPKAQRRFLDTFTGSHRPVLEYLLEDVLASQPPDIQTFLLETSFLDRLHASLCDAVTGRSDSFERLAHAERHNLFVEPLDGTGVWYRYHPLFAEAMQHVARQRFGEVHVRHLHQRASQWFAGQGMFTEAVEAALQAQCFDLAAGSIEQLLEPRLVRNAHHTLLRWIQALPEATLQVHPRLCMAYAQAILFTAKQRLPDREEALARPLEMAERFWTEAGYEPGLGQVCALRALIAVRMGDYPRSFSLARQALPRLPDSVGAVPDLAPHDRSSLLEWRGISLIFVGHAAYLGGQLNRALEALVEARSLLDQAGNIYGMLNIAILLAEIHSLRGETQQAEALYQQVLAEASQAQIDRVDALRRQGRAQLGLANLAFERGDLEVARELGVQALAAGEELHSQEQVLYAAWLLARLEWAQGEIHRGRERLAAVTARTQPPVLLRLVKAWQARLALADGDLASAQRWAAARQESGVPLADSGAEQDPFPANYREQEALVLARVQIAGGEPEAAYQVLEGWQADAQAHGRLRSELELGLLIALAQAAQNRHAEAKQTLAQTLSTILPAGYMQVLRMEGETLLALLRQVAQEPGPAAGPARAVVQALAPAGNSLQPGLAQPGLPPLTEQEARVLQLLGAGLSNAEIAQELVVSVNTVKTHVKSIYRKLQVSSRREVRREVRRDARALSTILAPCVQPGGHSSGS